jgi:nitrate/nitrite transporter NarK
MRFSQRAARSAPRAAVPLSPPPALAIGALADALLVMAIATAAAGIFATGDSAASAVLLVVLTLALAYGIARAWSAAPKPRRFARNPGFITGFAALGVGLHVAAGLLWSASPAPEPAPWLLIAVSLIFIALFFFQALLWRAARHPLGRALYVHALNGFYVSTLANRALNRLWPRTAPSL